MSYKRLFLLILIIFFTTIGCKKDSLTPECQKLKDAMALNNRETVKSIILEFIGSLPSQEYTQQNLNALAESLTSQCTISAEVLCFDCIDTLPGQSEIKVSFISSGTLTHKIIDISYSPDNTMKFLNMHE